MAAFFVIMPVPVKGAILLYVACFMIVSGWQLIMTRPMDTRTTIVVGASIIGGLSIDFLPDLYEQLPASFHAITCPPLSFATVMAILLNMLFQIGIRRSRQYRFDLESGSLKDLVGFLQESGADWGLRPEVVRRASDSLMELADIVIPHHEATEMHIGLSFDKVNLELAVRYDGRTISFPANAPHPDDIAAGTEHLHLLSAHLVCHTADDTHSSQEKNRNFLRLRFLH